jgi:hypothetical protein
MPAARKKGNLNDYYATPAAQESGHEKAHYTTPPSPTPSAENATLPPPHVSKVPTKKTAVPRKYLNELQTLVEHVGPTWDASVCGVHRTTLGRWLSGSVAVPRCAINALRAADGRAPGMAGKWDGWRFVDGVLWSPDGVPYTPGDLLAQQYERPLIRSLERQVREYEARIVRLTKAAAAVDSAANQSHTWPNDPASRAFSSGGG